MRGNRVGKYIGLAGEVTATVDAQDRLLQLGAEALEYDLNGRAVARSGGQLPATYVWDAFGRLREARLNPSQPTEIAVAYGLDPAGRRVRAVAKDASGAVLEDRSWVYDGQLRVIAEVSASGALRARYLYASSGHSPDLAVTFDPASGLVTGSYLLVHDQVGSVVRTVDLATGVAVEVVAYDPWGVATLSPGGTAVHPFGFAGGPWDRRTGLVRFGAREYDAGLGRWLARDPIGFAGGWNHCAYAAGDPVGLVDSLGYWPSDPDYPLPPQTPGGAKKALDGARAGFLYGLYEFGVRRYPLFELFSEFQGDSGPKHLEPCGPRHSPDQAALNSLLKQAKKRGKLSPISEEEADTLLNWAAEYFDNLYHDKHGPHKSPNDFHHIHGGGEDHIPFTPK